MTPHHLRLLHLLCQLTLLFVHIHLLHVPPILLRPQHPHASVQLVPAFLPRAFSHYGSGVPAVKVLFGLVCRDGRCIPNPPHHCSAAVTTYVHVIFFGWYQ